jgi:hypothetical protein
MSNEVYKTYNRRICIPKKKKTKKISYSTRFVHVRSNNRTHHIFLRISTNNNNYWNNVRNFVQRFTTKLNIGGALDSFFERKKKKKHVTLVRY